MFRCRRCDAVLWTSYNNSRDGTVVCYDCYKKDLDHTLNGLKDNLAYEILYNIVEKYRQDIPEDAFRSLYKLLKVKYDTPVNSSYLSDMINILEREIEINEEIKKLERFEREFKNDSSITHFCDVCKERIAESVYEYSMNHFDKALCMEHQKEQRATPQAKKLHYSLKRRGIDCELEAYDGHKHVDISIKNAKLNIEIDGRHHSLDPKQLNSDLIRDDYSKKDGFATKRYTNREIDEDLEGIADALAEVVEQRIKESQ